MWLWKLRMLFIIKKKEFAQKKIAEARSKLYDVGRGSGILNPIWQATRGSALEKQIEFWEQYT